MQVETYEVLENEDAQPEATEEAIALIEDLGLEGQGKLLSPEDEGKSRCPYRAMTNQEVTVYHEILPQKAKVETYDRDSIPLRVLQVVSHARQYFERLTVWYNATMPDPILVGENGSEYSPDERMILARWGPELESFSELALQAGESMKARREAKLRQIQAEVVSELACVKDLPTQAFVNGDVSATPSWYK